MFIFTTSQFFDIIYSVKWGLKIMKAKQHFNFIVRKALTINNHLDKLRDECKACIDAICEHADDYDYDDYIYELALLKQTLEDLASFDLEDSIPAKHENNY